MQDLFQLLMLETIEKSRSEYSFPIRAWVFLIFGGLLLVAAWQIPSRFNSIPFSVLSSAGQGTDSLQDLARASLAEGEVGLATWYAETMGTDGIPGASPLENYQSSSPLVRRWGVWDPFLDAALSGVGLDQYSQQPGAIGIALSKPCREALREYLEFSRNPLVAEILSTGELNNYKRFFPVYSASGRPLDATLLILGLLAQSDSFATSVRKELRIAIYDAKSGGNISRLEDFYLDMMSLGRLLDWGQLERLVSEVEDIETFSKLRYAFHHSPDRQATLGAAGVATGSPDLLVEYLEKYGDSGLNVIYTALNIGTGSLELLLREQLLVEGLNKTSRLEEAVGYRLADFSLRHRNAALLSKYGMFFFGSFFCFWGMSCFGRFYRDRTSSLLTYMQRVLASSAVLLVLIVISEPNLAGDANAEGYSFSFVMPVVAQVDGEMQIIETTPTTTMSSSTIISIAFFFLMQLLVFFICMLKVREINHRRADPLVKLRLMENEENLFDTGLYVGIAGTCISLVLQVLNLIDANLIAAYSSNLFGILCVAIVKIRLVRPYKNRLILQSEERIVALSGGSH